MAIMTTDAAKRYAADPSKTPRKQKGHPKLGAPERVVRPGEAWARLKEMGKEGTR